MKYVQHAKTFKPESLAGHELIKGHVHTQINIEPPSAEAIEMVKDKFANNKYQPTTVSTHSPSYEAINDSFIGGPVMIDHTTVHPSNISLDQALDALKSHGVMFKSVSLNLSVHGTEFYAEMSVLDHDTAMELHKWLYGKGG
jgi:hypothetical protein